MKFTILTLLILALSACGTSNSLLITQENNPDTEDKATVDSILFITKKDHRISISGFPLTNSESNRTNMTYGWGIDARWQNINLGEIEVALANRKRVSQSFSGFGPSDQLKNFFQYHVAYSYPVLKWQKAKYTQIRTSIKEDKNRYVTLFPLPVERSLNLRVAVHNDFFYQTSSNAFYPDILAVKYNESEPNDTYSYWTDRRPVLIEQSSTILRFGISLKNIQHVFINYNHPTLKAFTGKKDKYGQFYIDFMLLVQNPDISPVNYDFLMRSYSNPGNTIQVTEEIDFETHLTKQNWGACLGYYHEFYLGSSPVILTLKSELGIRPGYFIPSVWNENYYFRLGIGLGGGFQLKHKNNGV